MDAGRCGNLVAMATAADGPESDAIDLDARVAAIYGGPLDAFVAERSALSRELRQAGRRDDAAHVKGLRKPKLVAWALDAGRAADPGATAGLAAAVDEVADAQADVGDVRGALSRLRTAELAVVSAAEQAARDHGRPLDRAALASALRAVVGDPDALGALQAGRLVDAGPSAGAAHKASGTAARGAAAARPGQARPARGGRGDAPAPPDDRALVAARRAVDEAERSAAAADRAAAEAAAAADAAHVAAERAEDEAAAARRRADEVLGEAQRTRAEAEARAAEQEAAAAALAAARAALRDLDG